jgi:hypothetical protein
MRRLLHNAVAVTGLWCFGTRCWNRRQVLSQFVKVFAILICTAMAFASSPAPTHGSGWYYFHTNQLFAKFCEVGTAENISIYYPSPHDDMGIILSSWHYWNPVGQQGIWVSEVSFEKKFLRFGDCISFFSRLRRDRALHWHKVASVKSFVGRFSFQKIYIRAPDRSEGWSYSSIFIDGEQIPNMFASRKGVPLLKYFLKANESPLDGVKRFGGSICAINGRFGSFLSLFPLQPSVKNGGTDHKNSQQREDGGDDYGTPIGGRLSKKWSLFISASLLIASFGFGLHGLWLVYTSAGVENVGIINRARLFTGIAFVVVFWIAFHAALCYQEFGRIYLEQLIL